MRPKDVLKLPEVEDDFLTLAILERFKNGRHPGEY
jgi:hypothetical protein